MFTYTPKVSLLLALFTISFFAHAQYPQGLSEQDMQNMMQKMSLMQACIEKIDKSELESMEKVANEFESEVKALCANGDRAKAQSKAIKFGMEISQSDSMKQMRECGKIMEGMMSKLPISMPDWDKDYKNSHVCDAYQ